MFIRGNRKYGGMVEWPLNPLCEELDSGLITGDTAGKTLAAPGVHREAMIWAPRVRRIRHSLTG